MKPFAALSATLAYGYLESPVGALLVAGDDDGLHCISFPREGVPVAPRQEWRRDEARFKGAYAQLSAYFDGKLRTFDLPLRFTGTDFQHAVWQALMDIPFGETMSYGALATMIGKPGASRAVGAANNANPLPIIAPCHRVIGADRSLIGFGGGLETKTFLLNHERRVTGLDGEQRLLPF